MVTSAAGRVLMKIGGGSAYEPANVRWAPAS